MATDSMSETESTEDHSSPRVSEEQLFTLFRSVKREDDVPALVTSQINDLGGFEYSTHGLNQRLMSLHEDGILGHQKAGNRHMWWLAGEGTTEPVDLSSLHELIEFDNLDAEQFSEEKAREIASETIPGFKQNWWERIATEGDNHFRMGTVPFVVSLTLLVAAPPILPSEVLEAGLLIGIMLIFFAAGHYAVGITGGFLAKRTPLSEEPWGGRNLKDVVWKKAPFRSKT